MPDRAPYSYRHDSLVPAFPDDRPIIVYDGHCVLCAGWVEFVLRRDKKKLYRFLSAQSPLGRALYVHYDLPPEIYETNILIAEGRAWLKSEGSIRMAEGLGLPWSLAGALRVLPAGLRDRLYEMVARRRLTWFGRRDVCFRSREGFEDRFLG